MHFSMPAKKQAKDSKMKDSIILILKSVVWGKLSLKLHHFLKRKLKWRGRRKLLKSCMSLSRITWWELMKSVPGPGKGNWSKSPLPLAMSLFREYKESWLTSSPTV